MARELRGDVQGLRAVAVLLVIAAHAGVPFLPGGFIGVAVFYVISGFRYGFLGTADSPVRLGSAVVLAIDVALGCSAIWRCGAGGSSAIERVAGAALTLPARRRTCRARRPPGPPFSF